MNQPLRPLPSPEAHPEPGMYYSPEKSFYGTVRAPGTYGRTIMPLVEYSRATGKIGRASCRERVYVLV